MGKTLELGENMGKPKVQLVGQKFERLLVIKDLGIINKKHIFECQCSCGNIVKKHSRDLLSGNTRSCGCIRIKKDETIGLKVNKLIVKEMVVMRKDNRGYNVYGYICDCECGNEITVRGDILRKGKIQSCGCLQSTAFGYISGKHFSTIKTGALKRNLEFNITIEFISDLFVKQNKKCALTNWDIVLNPISKGPITTASLDRIDSTKGYTEDNVQWVHIDVNFAKQEYKQDYFIKMCRDIVNKADKQSQDIFDLEKDGLIEWNLMRAKL